MLSNYNSTRAVEAESKFPRYLGVKQNAYQAARRETRETDRTDFTTHTPFFLLHRSRISIDLMRRSTDNRTTSEHALHLHYRGMGILNKLLSVRRCTLQGLSMLRLGMVFASSSVLLNFSEIKEVTFSASRLTLVLDFLAPSVVTWVMRRQRTPKDTGLRAIRPRLLLLSLKTWWWFDL